MRSLMMCVATALVLVALAPVSAAPAAPPTIRVDDWNNDGVEDCNGFDQVDDTVCWQNALNTARGASVNVVPHFGKLEATSGASYIISGTLTLTRSSGGVISGNGATLEWRGPSGIPLLLLADTQHLEIRNIKFRVFPPVLPAFPAALKAAIEFTNAPNDPCQYCNVAPKTNILDNVVIEGVNTFALDYGVMFTLRHGIDEDNDQTTIMNSTIAGVMKAAISIEGQNSVQHRFYSVNGYGATNNGLYNNDDASPLTGPYKGASFVRLKHGSFHSIGGFQGTFQHAQFYLEAAEHTVTIIDANSEGCAHFLSTIDGAAAYLIPVHVYGGRFSLDGLAANGRVVDVNRYGPMTFRGMMVHGTKPATVSGDPKFHFNPNSPFVGDHQPVPYEVSDLTLGTPGSSSWNLFSVNSDVRLTSRGNMCTDLTSKSVPCTGLAAGTNDATESVKNKNYTDPSNVFPSSLATVTGAQSLSNKDLTSATNTFPAALTTLTGVQALAYKDLTSVTNSFPPSLATLTGAQSLTNKTLTDPTNILPVEPVDFAVHLDQTAVAWSNLPLLQTELFTAQNQRLKVDLTRFTQFRVQAVQTVAAFSGSRLRLQFSTNQTTWTDIENVGTAADLPLSTSASTQLLVGSWGALKTAARADVFLRVTGLGGNGNADPKFFGIRIQAK